MVRNAQQHDFARILEIYRGARAFMANRGNPTQWGDDYPPTAMLEEDIRRGELFVAEDGGRIWGVFALITGPDETYAVIEDGRWLSDREYGTIHRLASDGSRGGLLEHILPFCRKKISHLRIDTHPDNHVMQRSILRNGFQRCGIIHVQDGSPRIAYERL